MGKVKFLLFGVVLVLLFLFVLINWKEQTINFLVFELKAPLSIALFLAACLGGIGGAVGAAMRLRESGKK